MSHIPRSLMRRVDRLEAQHEPPAEQRGLRIVYGEGLAPMSEQGTHQEDTTDDARRVLLVLYGSARPESLI